MTLEEIKNYFGSGAKAAAALGYTRATWGKWHQLGHCPLLNQFLFEKMTGGELKADIKHTNYKRGAHVG